MTRKTAVGAMTSALLLSLICASWYAIADWCESAIALLDDFVEIAIIYFMNICLSGEILEDRNKRILKPE